MAIVAVVVIAAIILFAIVYASGVPADKGISDNPIIMNNTDNLLTNPSFETFNSTTGIASGWTNESETAGTPVYSQVTGVQNGSHAQHIRYDGTNGDNGKGKVELYQAPINVTAGQVLTFNLYVSGSLSKCAGIVCMESFEPNGKYISEQDSYVSGLTSNPQSFNVTYQVPENATYAAVCIQLNEICPSSSFDITIYYANLS